MVVSTVVNETSLRTLATIAEKKAIIPMNVPRMETPMVTVVMVNPQAMASQDPLQEEIGKRNHQLREQAK